MTAKNNIMSISEDSIDSQNLNYTTRNVSLTPKNFEKEIMSNKVNAKFEGLDLDEFFDYIG